MDSALHQQGDLVFETFFDLVAHAQIGLSVEFTQAGILPRQSKHKMTR